MNDSQTTDCQMLADLLLRAEHERAELKARYDAINQAWKDSGIPPYVLDTPDWKIGWRILHSWLGLLDPRGQNPGEWERVCARSRPSSATLWEREVHIFSHLHCPMSGHSQQQAMIEEQGTQAILDWWQEISGRPIRKPTPMPNDRLTP